MIVSRNTRYSPLHAGPRAGIGMHTHTFSCRASAEAFVSSPRAQEVMGNVFGRKRALLDTLNALPDDTFQLVIAACGDDDGVLRFETVKGLACVSKALLQQQDRSLERRERLGEILSLSLSFAEKINPYCVFIHPYGTRRRLRVCKALAHRRWRLRPNTWPTTPRTTAHCLDA